MQFLFDFVDWLTLILTSLWNFFVNIIDNTILLVKYLGVAANACYTLVSTLPSWLQAFALITIAISIIYMILGRNSGKG